MLTFLLLLAGVLLALFGPLWAAIPVVSLACLSAAGDLIARIRQ
jgi:hypothetical protein